MERVFALALAFIGLMVGWSACGGRTAGTDGGTVATYDLCAQPSDCLVRSTSCCGTCGAATRGDIVAISVGAANAYAVQACSGSNGCPTCFGVTDARLVATCRAGHCAVVDLATHPSTACAVSSDCRVRTSECCECGGEIDERHIIAVAAGGDPALQAQVCDSDQACPECAPIYPANVQATCDSGHCKATWVDR